MKIVYVSNTGMTEKYAKMLSAKIGVECFDEKSAKKAVEKGEEIIFMGWVLANQIAGYKAAAKRYNIQCVCAVGMNNKSETNSKILTQTNKLTAPLFYLQGGLDFTKLRGLKRSLIKAVRDSLVKENKPENAQIIEVMTNGGDFVCEDNLSEVIVFSLMKGI